MKTRHRAKQGRSLHKITADPAQDGVIFKGNITDNSMRIDPKH